MAATAGATLLLSGGGGRLREPWELVTGGVARLVFAGMLVALTGGALTPFFFVLPLLVVAAAVVVRPAVALSLTGGAAAVYLAAIAASNVAFSTEPMSQLAVATACADLASLCLVGWVGMAIGREHAPGPRGRDLPATVDPLTGLRTRPYLLDALERELARSQHTAAATLLMIDLDDLKAINRRRAPGPGRRCALPPRARVAEIRGSKRRRWKKAARPGACCRDRGDRWLGAGREDPRGRGRWGHRDRRGRGADLGVGGHGHVPNDGKSGGELLERADAGMSASSEPASSAVRGSA